MLRRTAVACLLWLSQLAFASRSRSPVVAHLPAIEVRKGEIDSAAAELAAKVDKAGDPFTAADANHDGQVSRAEFKADVAEAVKNIRGLTAYPAGGTGAEPQPAPRPPAVLGPTAAGPAAPIELLRPQLPMAVHALAIGQAEAREAELDDATAKLAAKVDDAGDPFHAADTNHDGQVSKAEFKVDVAKAVEKLRGLTGSDRFAGKAGAELQLPLGPRAGQGPAAASPMLLERSAQRWRLLPTWHDFGAHRGLRVFSDPEDKKESSEIYGVQKWIWVVLADCLAMLTFCACIPIILTCAKKKRPNFPG